LSDPRNRARVFWLAGIGGVLLLSLLFITLLAPAGASTPAEPVLRPQAGGTALATEPAPSTSAPAPARGFSIGGGEALSLAWRLGLVAIIIGVSVVGLRWWGRRTAGPRSSSGLLRVVDTLAIGNGRAIHLVALGERVIAVGATAQQLSLLAELGEAECERLLAPAAPGREQSLSGFADELLRMLGRERGAPVTPAGRPFPGGEHR
jgi:flagellar biogenesis protein FliO